MYCSNCGKKIRKDSRFCFSCGAEVSLEPADKTKRESSPLDDAEVTGKRIDPTTRLPSWGFWRQALAFLPLIGLLAGDYEAYLGKRKLFAKRELQKMFLEAYGSAHAYKPDSAAWFLGIVIYVITSGVLTQATGRWNAFMLPMLLFCIVCAAKGKMDWNQRGVVKVAWIVGSWLGMAIFNLIGRVEVDNFELNRYVCFGVSIGVISYYMDRSTLFTRLVRSG